MITKIKYLKNHQGFIRYLQNTIWMMAEQFLRIIAGLFVGIWVARYLGPEQFGLFSYVLAFTAIFGGIAKLGLDGILVRELVNHPEKRDIYLGTAFWLKVVGAFLVMILMIAIVPFTSNNGTTNIYIFIIAAGLIFQSFEVVEFYFQSQVLAKIVSICKVIQLALSSVIKIYLVLSEAELIYFVLVTVFDAFSLAVSYSIAYLLQKKPAFYKKIDFRIAIQLIKDSWPLIFSGILVMVYMRIDQVMIQEMLGKYEVGIYSAAVRISEAFYFIPMLIANSLFPAILNAKNQNDELYKQRLQRLYKFMVWMAITIVLPMTFFSDFLIFLLFGQAYQEAGEVLTVHAWASVFVFLGVASGKWFMLENLQRFTLINTSVGAILNVVMNFILIPRFGVVGAAYATLISYGVAAYLMNSVWKVSRFNFLMLSRSLLMFRKI
ncbi:flippase [Methylophaga thalassica]|uniref:flippase n=1 Tax=Methylophaga thalassica TaxID=40223 RepID=UPI002E7B6003|nr:flippase [Methylophaga thalassica]WVI86104.1 flippase [Methylophaga thalassica]